MADDKSTPEENAKTPADLAVTGTDATFPKQDGTPQAPNGIAAADQQTTPATPATAAQPVNGVPVADAPSNENHVEQISGSSTEDHVNLIGLISDDVKRNYEDLVDSGVRTWHDIERNAVNLADRATAAFARKRAAESGQTVDATAASDGKTTR